MVLPCSPRFPGANYVAQAAVKVTEILLLQLSECLSYSGPHHAHLSLFSMHRSPGFWSSEIVSSMPILTTFRGKKLGTHAKEWPHNATSISVCLLPARLCAKGCLLSLHAFPELGSLLSFVSLPDFSSFLPWGFWHPLLLPGRGGVTRSIRGTWELVNAESQPTETR